MLLFNVFRAMPNFAKNQIGLIGKIYEQTTLFGYSHYGSCTIHAD